MAKAKAKRAKKKPVRKASKPAPRTKPSARKAPPKAKATARVPEPPKWGAAQAREFAAIQSRAAELAKSLKAADFDHDGVPVEGEWSRMLADLAAWSSRYGVKAKVNEHQHPPAPASGGTPTPMSHCAGTTTGTEIIKIGKKKYKVTTTCLLHRETLLGRCVYNCYESGFSAV